MKKIIVLLMVMTLALTGCGGGDDGASEVNNNQGNNSNEASENDDAKAEDEEGSEQDSDENDSTDEESDKSEEDEENGDEDDSDDVDEENDTNASSRNDTPTRVNNSTDRQGTATKDVTNENITGATASSYLVENLQSGTLEHSPGNVIDGNAGTAWVENVQGIGAGQWIEIQFDGEYNLNGLEISNGYQKSQDIYQKNSRPSKIKLHFSDGTTHEASLSDSYGMIQLVGLDSPVKTSSVRVEILEAYTGSQYTDTCISDIYVY